MHSHLSLFKQLPQAPTKCHVQGIQTGKRSRRSFSTPWDAKHGDKQYSLRSVPRMQADLL